MAYQPTAGKERIMGQHIYAEKLARCVRADNNAAYNAHEFADNGDGTVSDNATDLMWQQKINFQLYNWEGAIQYCENMELAGRNDWHLPNVKEGVSIVDYNRHDPTIDTKFFPNTPSDRFFWLSTSDAIENAQNQPDIFFKPPFPANPARKSERIAMNHGPDYGHNVGWAVEIIVGSAFRYTKNQEFYARCVRYDD